MTTTTPTLTDWLELQIAADEGVAHETVDCYHGSAPCCEQMHYVGGITPARVLAECAAKRAIVAGAEDERQRASAYNRSYDAGELTSPDDLRFRLDANVRWGAMDRVLRALASVYRDREGWQEAWS